MPRAAMGSYMLINRLMRVICSAAHSRQYLITSQIGWMSSEGQQWHSLSSSSMRFCSLGFSRGNFYFLEPWHSSCLPPGSKTLFPRLHSVRQAPRRHDPCSKRDKHCLVSHGSLGHHSCLTYILQVITCQSRCQRRGYECVSRLLVPRVFTWWLYLWWMAANKWGLNVTVIVVGYEICWAGVSGSL